MVGRGVWKLRDEEDQTLDPDTEHKNWPQESTGWCYPEAVTIAELTALQPSPGT